MFSAGKNIKVPIKEFEFTFARSGGPGGQNVNKVNSKAILRWPVSASSSIDEAVKERFCERYANRISSDGDLIISSQRYREQSKNVGDCLDKLKSMLESVEEEPVSRKPTKTPKAVRQKRVDEKRQRSVKKRLRRPPPVEES